MSELVEHLREHADQVAGDGPSGSAYDPETLALEHDAADRIEALEAEVEDERERHDALLREVTSMLPPNAQQYMDPPDGGDVTQTEILRRYITDLLRRIPDPDDLRRLYNLAWEGPSKLRPGDLEMFRRISATLAEA